MTFSNERLSPNTRVALQVEYNGAGFNGWQAQANSTVHTVQEAIETALGKIAATSIRTHCAGRTDTGVHASGQIVHFDDPVGRSLKSWVLGANSEMPSTVAVHWAGSVASDFHARFSATSRHYRYVICNTPTRPAQLTSLVTWHRRPLDAEAMNAASKLLLGERDFSAFRAASCQSSTPWRQMLSISVERVNNFIIVDLTANAFLHHMVRNIVGSLLLVGSRARSIDWFGSVLASKDRTLAGDTAASAGLYLVSVAYPEEFGIPTERHGPAFLSVSV